MSIQNAINKVSRREHLTVAEAEAAMDEIMAGAATPAQIGGYLMGLRIKGETIDEITGSAIAMRRAASKPTVTRSNLIDTCGTGGDGVGTFNISTTVAFVATGAGLNVAKHGNRSISSKSGSADVLSALGVKIDLTPQQVGECIDQVGIGFMFAPAFNPSMKYASGPRRELAIRTIFNVLGPLTNPAGARRQLMGVYAAELVEPLAHTLQLLGSEAAIVVHGDGGLDELTTTGPNHVSELRHGKVTSYVLEPESLGFTRAERETLLGGDPTLNASITRGILDGSIRDSRRDVVLLNAAAALVVGASAETLAEGLTGAVKSIDSGAALAKLDALVAYSQKFVAVAQ
jgi:anthranilate phosphoribosyltransferase